MTYGGATAQVLKATGTVYYVATDGNDSNAGTDPEYPLLTIGAAITAVADYDTVVVAGGTYTETGLDLDHAGVELIFRAGVILDPASGTALTISGYGCKVHDHGCAAKIAPAAGATGVVVSGNFVCLADIRVAAASTAAIGYDITGAGAVIENCRCSAPTTAAFKVQGDKCKIEDCCTGGESGDSSIGFWVTNSCDKLRILDCSSQGNETASYQIDAGCTNAMVRDSASGPGDGAPSNLGTNCTFTNFAYNGVEAAFSTPIVKTTTFAGAPTTYNIFEVTGAIRLIDIVGHVTTVIPNTASTIHLEAYSTNGTVDITDAPGPDIDSYVADAVLSRLSDASEALQVANPSAGPAIAEVAAGGPQGASKNVVEVVADPGATTYIRLVLSAALASGAIHWHAKFEPLTDDGFLEPA